MNERLEPIQPSILRILAPVRATTDGAAIVAEAEAVIRARPSWVSQAMAAGAFMHGLSCPSVAVVSAALHDCEKCAQIFRALLGPVKADPQAALN